MISTEVASITVLVTYYKDNEALSQIIPFKVYREEEKFKAVPLISNKDRELVNLPELMTFGLANDRIQPAKETKEEHFDVLRNIVSELRMQDILSRP